MIEIELAAKFAGMYQREKSILDFLIESAVPKRILLRTYELLIKEDLIKIEDLPEEIKQNLVRECRATGLRFTNETLREAARILHTLKFITATHLCRPELVIVQPEGLLNRNKKVHYLFVC